MTMIIPLPGNETMGHKLSTLLDAPLGQLETRQFPDGESYVRLADEVANLDVIFVCTLADPDDKLLRLIFAADAARDLGARAVTLVAPYLAYMRQDHRFRSGEAISSRSFARILSGSFDRLITVSPHLHRYASLTDIYGIEAVALDAAPLFAGWITDNVKAPFLLGPDAESEQWVARVAELAGAPFAICEKIRNADRGVELSFPELQDLQGRQPVIVDDIVSSGATLIEAGKGLRSRGFSDPICLAVHGLHSARDGRRIRQHVKGLLTTDSIPNGGTEIGLAPLIVQALRSSHLGMPSISPAV